MSASFLNLGRSSASRAGHYPFLVRVQAMETGEVGVAQATLEVKPFSDLQLELTPKRGLATFFRPLNEFQVTLANLGNAEETLDLYANDPDDECAYEFDTERLTLKPGQNENINLAMRPKTTAFLGGMKLYGFTVSARATADAYVSASSRGQLEKRALISPLSGIFLILLALGSGLTYAFWPHPPPPVRLIKFNSDQPKVGNLPARVNAGAEVKVSWDAQNAKKIVLFQKVGKQDEVALPASLQPAPGQETGSIIVKPEAPFTTYYAVITGEGEHNEKRDYFTINVTPPPPAPQPKITAFRATPAIIHQGEPIVLQWEARGADRLILDPGNTTLSSSHQFAGSASRRRHCLYPSRFRQRREGGRGAKKRFSESGLKGRVHRADYQFSRPDKKSLSKRVGAVDLESYLWQWFADLRQRPGATGNNRIGKYHRHVRAADRPHNLYPDRNGFRWKDRDEGFNHHARCAACPAARAPRRYARKRRPHRSRRQ